ncbi:PadR family transcriptional regulator [Solibacillus sp. FSL H8-0538]|uniref:PadR family transcriptional regulator n=1 Tax=Solibacillus sp. FSL H8-0538 TaxID=2921400 RepID=UPI0030F98828
MTRLMVLGLLRLKPMSGYEIQQILHTNQSDQWAGILPGSIYHALKKMNTEGLVKIASIESTGNRSKAIYEITENGDKEYYTLLLESFSTSSIMLPTSLYTGLSMLSLPNPDLKKKDILNNVVLQRENLEKQFANLVIGLEEKQKHLKQNNPFYNLTYKNIKQQFTLQMDCLKELEELLNNEL